MFKFLDFSQGLKFQRWYPFHLPPPPPSPSPSPPPNFVPTPPHAHLLPPRSRFKVILFQEKLTIDGIRLIFDSLARSIGHLHVIGRIHGDIKPLNIVRTFDDRIMLIDLDMAVALREPVGAKQLSTAFVGPESTYQTVDADGGLSSARPTRTPTAWPSCPSRHPAARRTAAAMGTPQTACSSPIRHSTFGRTAWCCTMRSPTSRCWRRRARTSSEARLSASSWRGGRPRTSRPRSTIWTMVSVERG